MYDYDETNQHYLIIGSFCSFFLISSRQNCWLHIKSDCFQLLPEFPLPVATQLLYA